MHTKYIFLSSRIMDLGVAGGLTILSKMPACNFLLLGQQRKV
jgi:RNA processing factor Prp31